MIELHCTLLIGSEIHQTVLIEHFNFQNLIKNFLIDIYDSPKMYLTFILQCISHIVEFCTVSTAMQELMDSTRLQEVEEREEEEER